MDLEANNNDRRRERDVDINNNNNRNFGTSESFDDRPPVEQFIPPQKLLSKDWSSRIRMGFIRKVYGIIFVQLMLTVFMCIISMTNENFAKFQRNSLAMLITTAVLSIVILISLLCFKNFTRRVPVNYFLLFAFTFCEAYLVSYLCADTDPKLVLIAASLTAAITLGKDDITYAGGTLFIVSIALLACLILCIAMPSRFLIIIILSLLVILYGFYLIYDTKLVLGGGRFELSIDDYIIGALIIYLDIILLFVRILQILRLSN